MCTCLIMMLTKLWGYWYLFWMIWAVFVYAVAVYVWVQYMLFLCVAYLQIFFEASWTILAWHVDTSVAQPLPSGRGDIPELGPKPVPPKARCLLDGSPNIFWDWFCRDEHLVLPCLTSRFWWNTKVPALLAPCPFNIISAMDKESKHGFQTRVWPSIK